MSLYETIEKAEREAYRKGLKLYRIFMKLPPRWRKQANKILDELAYGKTTYEEALRRMRKLYREYLREKQRKRRTRPRKK